MSFSDYYTHLNRKIYKAKIQEETARKYMILARNNYEAASVVQTSSEERYKQFNNCETKRMYYIITDFCSIKENEYYDAKLFLYELMQNTADCYLDAASYIILSENNYLKLSPSELTELMDSIE